MQPRQYVSQISPQTIRNCIHHKYERERVVSRRSHKQRIFHHISHTVVQEKCLAAFCRTQDQDDVWPFLNRREFKSLMPIQ